MMLAGGMKHLRHLRLLNLDRCWIEDQGVCHLVRAILGEEVGDTAAEGAADDSERTSGGGNGLTSSSSDSDSDGESVAGGGSKAARLTTKKPESARRLNKLRHLNLGQNPVGLAGFKAICELLPNLLTLEELAFGMLKVNPQTSL